MIAVGVPLITPDPVLKVNPADNAGEIAHIATAPPPMVGTFAVIAVPVE